MIAILLFLAVIPVVIICTYIYRKDKNKEPGSLLVKLFGLGIASCFLVLIISSVVFKIFPFMQSEQKNFFETMAYAFIGVALIEELCKWLMTYMGAYSHKEYDEVYDGIVYAVYVSLGFAFFENLLYVLGNNSISVGISRGLLAVPGHACDAVFMGYYLSLAKMYSYKKNKQQERKNLLLSIIVPTILHGIYDFCLFSQIDILLLTFFIFVITIYIISIKKIKQLSEQSQPKHQPINQTVAYQQYNNQVQQQRRYCPNCGLEVNGSNFCRNCGTRQN